MSPRRNWESPNPSLASECAPPPRTGGGHIRLWVRGWGSPNSDDWKKSLALSVLYAVGEGGAGAGHLGDWATWQRPRHTVREPSG
jgi:hypothetical protein